MELLVVALLHLQCFLDVIIDELVVFGGDYSVGVAVCQKFDRVVAHLKGHYSVITGRRAASLNMT